MYLCVCIHILTYHAYICLLASTFNWYPHIYTHTGMVFRLSTCECLYLYMNLLAPFFHSNPYIHTHVGLVFESWPGVHKYRHTDTHIYWRRHWIDALHAHTYRYSLWVVYLCAYIYIYMYTHISTGVVIDFIPPYIPTYRCGLSLVYPCVFILIHVSVGVVIDSTVLHIHAYTCDVCDMYRVYMCV